MKTENSGPIYVGGKRAKIVGMHLGKLAAMPAGLTPQAVVEDARRPTSPIHDLFDWDDSTAAKKYRIWQARHLIGTVKVIYSHNPKNTPPVRGIVNIRREIDDDEAMQRYVTTAQALSDPDLRAQVLASAQREIIAWRERYRRLTELSPIFEAIERTIRRSRKHKTG